VPELRVGEGDAGRTRLKVSLDVSQVLAYYGDMQDSTPPRSEVTEQAGETDLSRYDDEIDVPPAELLERYGLADEYEATQQ
jgi:hypothetical protein